MPERLGQRLGRRHPHAQAREQPRADVDRHHAHVRRRRRPPAPKHVLERRASASRRGGGGRPRRARPCTPVGVVRSATADRLGRRLDRHHRARCRRRCSRCPGGPRALQRHRHLARPSPPRRPRPTSVTARRLRAARPGRGHRGRSSPRARSPRAPVRRQVAPLDHGHRALLHQLGQRQVGHLGRASPCGTRRRGSGGAPLCPVIRAAVGARGSAARGRTSGLVTGLGHAERGGEPLGEHRLARAETRRPAARRRPDGTPAPADPPTPAGRRAERPVRATTEPARAHGRPAGHEPLGPDQVGSHLGHHGPAAERRAAAGW